MGIEIKYLIKGCVFIALSFYNLLLILVLHSLGWTGGYLAILISLILMAAGYIYIGKAIE